MVPTTQPHGTHNIEAWYPQHNHMVPTTQQLQHNSMVLTTQLYVTYNTEEWYIQHKSIVSTTRSTVSTFIYFLFYVTFNSQGHIATGSLQVEETSAYCTVNHRAPASNYQLSNMKRPARDSNRRPQRLEV